MPSLNFKNRFVPLIESGAKRQTIRKLGKRYFIAGDKLYLFSGLRTKNCHRIFSGLIICPDFVRFETYKNKKSPIDVVPYVICNRCIRISLSYSFITFYDGCLPNQIMFMPDTLLDGNLPGYKHILDDFAIKDGFNNFKEFYQFFYPYFPFDGYLIQW